MSEQKADSFPLPQSQGSSVKATLSCELCRHRKIRCDKGDPCGTCQKAGVKCVPVNRQRLPRGRNGGRRKGDAELKARIGRLESLVKTLEAGNSSSDEASQSGVHALHQVRPLTNPSIGVSRF